MLNKKQKNKENLSNLSKTPTKCKNMCCSKTEQNDIESNVDILDALTTTFLGLNAWMLNCLTNKTPVKLRNNFKFSSRKSHSESRT